MVGTDRVPQHLPWRRALVTGATAGIGKAFARALADRGVNLVLVARGEERLRSVAEGMRSAYAIDAEVLAADLTDLAQVRRVEERFEDDGKPIDLLVNNAGGQLGLGNFLDRDRDHLTAEGFLNALALERLTHAAVGPMARRGRGNVINVSAGVAFYPTPGAVGYGASKAFVNSFTEGLDYELRGTGVRVTAICPGFTRTESHARLGMNIAWVPRSWWKDPEEVGLVAIRAALRGRVIVSPGFWNRVNAVLGRHLPRRFMARNVARAQRRIRGGQPASA